MLSKYLYPYYMGGVAILLPFAMRVSELNANVSYGKDHLFASLAVLGLLLFGFSSKLHLSLKIGLGLVLIHAYFVQMDFMYPTVVYQYVYFCAGLLLFAQAAANFDVDGFKVIFNAFSILVILQSAWIFSEYFFEFVASDLFNVFGAKIRTVYISGDGWKDVTDKAAVGSLVNRNYSGALLAICSISLFRRNWVWFLPVAIVALLILNSTMPIVALAFGGLVYTGIRLRVGLKSVIAVIMSLLLGLGMLCIAQKDQASIIGASGRLKAWEDTVKNAFVAKEVHSVTPTGAEGRVASIGGKYLVGHGLGYFAALSKYFIKEKINRNVRWHQVHNEYLSWFYAFGLIGLVYVAILMIPIFNGLAHRDPIVLGMVAALAVDSIGHFTFHVSGTAFIGIILLGLLYAQEGESI